MVRWPVICFGAQFEMARSLLVRSTALTLALAAAVLGGCAADEDPSSLKNRSKESETPTSSGDRVERPEGAFEYTPDLALLPFDVRLEKVARVAGVSTDDPILADLRARRFDLGDHDYASGLKPDLTWSASRITTWVKALKPVCASPAMRERYPALPEHLDALVLAAWGREVTKEDRAAVEEAIAASALDSESQYQVVCLAVLSALEFVAR